MADLRKLIDRWDNLADDVPPQDETVVDYEGEAREQIADTLRQCARDLEQALAARPEMPVELRGMSAKEREGWLAVEVLYNAGIAYTPGEARTMSTWRELHHEAQSALVGVLLPLFPILHNVGINPEARADYEAPS